MEGRLVDVVGRHDPVAKAAEIAVERDCGLRSKLAQVVERGHGRASGVCRSRNWVEHGDDLGGGGRRTPQERQRVRWLDSRSLAATRKSPMAIKLTIARSK